MIGAILKGWNTLIGGVQNVHSRFNSIQTIDLDHALIHDGIVYTQTDIRSMAIGSVVHHLIRVPGTVHPHLYSGIFDVIGSPCTVSLYEDSQVSSIGSICNSRNRNRFSVDSPSVIVSCDPVVTNSGTLLAERLIQGARQSGGISSGTDEWVLCNSTNYLLSIKNDSGVAISAGVKIAWVEKEDI